MSFFNLNYFKRHWFEHWGGYNFTDGFGGKDYRPVPGKRESVSGAGATGRWGWFGDWAYKVDDKNGWDSLGDEASFVRPDTKNSLILNGRVAKFPNFINKAVGREFIQKAKNAQLAYLRQNDAQEMWFLSIIMAEFLKHARLFLDIKHYRSWQNIDWRDDLSFADMGTGPWSKPIWAIFNAFEEWDEYGETIWQTIFKILAKTPKDLKISWALEQEKVKDEATYIDFFNLFFQAYDVDGKGIDFKNLKGWKSSRFGVRKTAYEQYTAAAEFLDGQRLFLKQENFTGADWANYPWQYGTPKRAAALFGSQVREVIKTIEEDIEFDDFSGLSQQIIEAYFVETHFDTTTVAAMVTSKNLILSNFKEAGLWGPSGEPGEDLRRPKTWMQEVGRKAKRLINRGLWLSPNWTVMSRLNLGVVDRKWKMYDQNVHGRVGFPFLQWSDYSFDSDGFQMAYAAYDNNGTELVYKLQSADIKNNPEKYIKESIITENKKAFDLAFNDGIALQAQGGKLPWVAGVEKNWDPKIEVMGTSEMKRTGLSGRTSPAGSVPVGNATPNDKNLVLSEEFWNGTNPPASSLRKEPINHVKFGDFTFFHKIDSGSPIDAALSSYGDYDAYIRQHFESRVKGDYKRKDGFYANFAKKAAYLSTALLYNFGNKIEEEKDGKVVPASGQLAKTYGVFLTEFRKNLEDKNSKLTDVDFFKEATDYLAYSLAAAVLSVNRDDIIFDIYNDFVKQTWDHPSSISEKDVIEALEETKKTQKQRAANAANQAAEADAEDLTDEDIENRQPFYKQCFLLMNMDLLKDQYAQDIVKAINSPTTNSLIHNKGNEFKGRIRLIDTDATDGDKTAVMNRLTSPMGEDIKGFFDARPELISALVPQIRLFRVQSKKVQPVEPNGDSLTKLTEIEFDFPKHNSPDRSQYKGDLQGARDKWEFGIKEFSFSFDGTSPATARNDIKATLTLFFRDFNDLIKKRTLTEFTSYGTKFTDPVKKVLERSENQYSYLDLILFPGSVHQKGSKHPFQYNPSEYRIRADVGWVTREGQVSNSFNQLCSNSNTTPDELKRSLEKINKSFYLNMVDHDLDFANDGSVTIKIEYRAYMESSAKSISLDVLATPAINSIRENIQKEMNQMWGKCSAEDMNQLLQTYRTIESEMLKKSYQSIITRLLRRRRMMYVYSEAKDRESFKNLGFFDQRPTMYSGKKAQASKTQPPAAIATLKSATESDASSDTFEYIDGELREFDETLHSANTSGLGLEVVNFFYVGDLFYTLMDCMYEAPDATKPGAIVGKLRDDVRNTKLLLSSFKYKDPLDVKKELDINIAQIPVAVDFFLEFMNKNVLEGERRNYPLMYFIRDFCNRLIVDLMNELCIKSINAENRIRFQTANLLALPITKGDDDPVSKLPMLSGTPIRNVTQGHKDGTLPFIGTLENRSINEAINYITIYPVASNMVNTDPNSAPRGIRSEDEKNGIRHLYIGRPRGLVKTVKFSKVDMQYIREARYFNHGYNGLMQLGSVYKASIDMVGNTLFYPGMTVFINPTSLASEGMDPTQGGDAGNAGQEPSLANALGIGGYHLITKVKSTIGPGKFNTTVDARFYYSGDGNSVQLQTPQQNTGPNAKTDREQEIDEVGKNTTLGKSTDACEAIIRIRQRQTGNIFGSEYNQDFGGLDDQAALLEESNIENKLEAESNALKQSQTSQERKAAEDAYKDRQAAIKKGGTP